MDSILNSIKKALGPDTSYTVFDPELIMFINTTIAALYQLGASSDSLFEITDENDKWSDYITDTNMLSFVKTYMYAKVKLIFDPPQSSAAVEALNKIASEQEWRITVRSDELRKEAQILST